jgi:rhamnosyltransferase subunit B
VNVLLFALGSHGDVHPFVGIGIRLKQRGHHVAVAANAYFQELVENAGLEFVTFGTSEEYRDLATNRDLWHPFRGPQAVFKGTARYLRPMYDIAANFAREHPHGVIVASSLALGARVAQDKLGFPLATVHLSPAIFQSCYDPPNLPVVGLMPKSTSPAVWRVIWRVANLAADSLIAATINALRRDVGLPAVRNMLGSYWHSPQMVIALFPEWFAPKPPDWPAQTRLTGFPLYDEPDITPISAELETFLNSGEPPIAFTPGSAMWQARQFFDASAQACVRLDRRGLLLTRHRDHLPPRLPHNVVHVHYAPFSKLLPRCAAFVHHGGIGSSAQALAAGVPQIVTPFTHDQPDNAARLAALGVARIIPPKKYDGARAARELRELIASPAVAQSCRRVAEKFVGVDAIGQTCELIESLAR